MLYVLSEVSVMKCVWNNLKLFRSDISSYLDHSWNFTLPRSYGKFLWPFDDRINGFPPLH